MVELLINAIIFAIMDASDKIKTAKNTEAPILPQTEILIAESNIKNSITNQANTLRTKV